MLFKPKFRLWALIITILMVLGLTLWASQAKSQYISDSVIRRGGSWAILRAFKLGNSETITIYYRWVGLQKRPTSDLLGAYFIHFPQGYGKRKIKWVRAHTIAL